MFVLRLGDFGTTSLHPLRHLFAYPEILPQCQFLLQRWICQIIEGFLTFNIGSSDPVQIGINLDCYSSSGFAFHLHFDSCNRGKGGSS